MHPALAAMNPTDLTIRKAEFRDIPEIQRLYRQLDQYHVDLLPEVFQTVDGNARGDDFLRKFIERNNADYLLAELNGTIVGFINVQKSAHPPYPSFRHHEFAMIEDAVVDMPLRGKGIGRKLFTTAIEWARQHDLKYIQTSVWHDNEGAREFYLEEGFRPMTMRMELDITLAAHS